MAEIATGEGYSALLVPRIEEIMDFMREWCPPLRFPADGGGLAEEAPDNWVRGGTSPSGRSFGDVDVANYFIGAQYMVVNMGGAPQRIVWVPPAFGAERFARPDSNGWHIGAGAAQAGGGDIAEDRAFRRLATRIVPVHIDLWADDHGDLDVLINWVYAGVDTTNAGAPAMAGVPPVETGGEVEAQAGQRGIRYQLLANLVFPVVAPYRVKRRAQHVGVDVRVETEHHAIQRAAAALAAPGEHPLDRSPWRRTSVAPPASEPVAPDEDDG